MSATLYTMANFSRIFSFHPVFFFLNIHYHLFFLLFNHLILTTGELLNNRTLFSDIMHCLESAIQPVAKPTSALMDDFMMNDSLNDSQPLLTYQQWESKHAQKYLVGHSSGFDWTHFMRLNWKMIILCICIGIFICIFFWCSV